MPDEPPKITLTEQEAAFWALWCNLFFNKDIAPGLTMTAYGHVRKLAPHIISAEQMESLAKKARKDLEDNTGVKRKTVYLGNCVNSYPGWKQEQAAQGPPKPQGRPTLDEVECTDPTWHVYKRPGDDQEWILWQGELCTPEEADERGYNGGGGLYITTKYR